MRVLKQAGWEIGWHTNTHMNLLDAKAKEIAQDFSTEKQSFESSYTGELKYVAYPFGKYNREVENFARGAGFNKAFTVDGYKADTKKYSIDRVTVSAHMNANDVVSLISPMGIMVNKLFTFAWQIKDKY